MKLVLLAGTASLALAVSGSAAHAVPFDFTYIGSLVTFTVPTTDTYQILAFGAQGGDSIGTGGRGAEIGGDFSLTAGESLQIAVGGAGMNGDAGGGGGGSFVVGPGNAPLVIAGGGGGGGGDALGAVPHLGQGGLIGPDGGPGGLSGGNGGTGGNGGAAGTFVGGGGGGGFFTAGGSGAAGGGGGAFPGLAGGSGASNGGFGGGGGGGPAIRTRGAAGGGGGYSGGGGGSNGAMGDFGAGGGGGSFDAGRDQILVGDFQTGNGEVVITEIAAAVPEPATIALLGAGLISLATVRRRKPPVG